MQSGHEPIPERLKEARERAGLKQQELASRAGVDPSLVSHYEAGRRTPGIDYVNKLADLSGIPTAWFFGVDTPAGMSDWASLVLAAAELTPAEASQRFGTDIAVRMLLMSSILCDIGEQPNSWAGGLELAGQVERGEHPYLKPRDMERAFERVKLDPGTANRYAVRDHLILLLEIRQLKGGQA